MRILQGNSLIQMRIFASQNRVRIIHSCLTAAVTTVFYFVLGALHTANLIVSTVSVATSFFAASLTVLRSPFYALAYTANDVVLIVLWIAATRTDISSLPMVFCFVMFLANDLYGLYSWLRMQRQQAQSAT